MPQCILRGIVLLLAVLLLLVVVDAKEDAMVVVVEAVCGGKDAVETVDKSSERRETCNGKDVPSWIQKVKQTLIQSRNERKLQEYSRFLTQDCMIDNEMDQIIEGDD